MGDLVKGGQGRDALEIRHNGFSFGLCMAIGVLLGSSAPWFGAWTGVGGDMGRDHGREADLAHHWRHKYEVERDAREAAEGLLARQREIAAQWRDGVQDAFRIARERDLELAQARAAPTKAEKKLARAALTKVEEKLARADAEIVELRRKLSVGWLPPPRDAK